MTPLARLLQPYMNAVQGVPTTSASMARDPLLSLLQPAPSSLPGSTTTSHDGEGLHPVLQQLMQRLPWLDVVSGYRTNERQQELWQQALAKYGDPEIADNWVARPGTSNHESGTALDVASEDISRLLKWLGNHQKYGSQIFRPMEHEPWHFEVGG